MTEKPTPKDVDAFLDSTVVDGDPSLSAALEASSAAGLPPIAVSVQQGKFLSLLAGAIGARSILELGTLGGFSTIWLARGAGPQGRVVTLEYEPKHAEVARGNLERAGLADRVEVVVGAALDTLPTVTGPFDLIFIDADKENYPAYLEWAVRLARPGAVIVADNVIRQGQILDQDVAAFVVEAAERLLGGDQTAAAEGEVDDAQHAEPAHLLRPGLQPVQLVGQIGGPDRGPDGGSADDVGLDPDLLQCAQDADMRPAARSAAAQRQPDFQVGPLRHPLPLSAPRIGGLI